MDNIYSSLILLFYNSNKEIMNSISNYIHLSRERLLLRSMFFGIALSILLYNAFTRILTSPPTRCHIQQLTMLLLPPTHRHHYEPLYTIAQ